MGSFGVTELMVAVLLQQGQEGQAIVQLQPAAKPGLLQQVEGALEGLFGNVLNTFNLLFGLQRAPLIVAVMVVGLIYLFFGWRIYKLTLVVAGLALGSIVGFWLGEWFGKTFMMNARTTSLIGSIVLGLVLAALAIPFVRLMVFVFCGVSAAVLICYLCERSGLGFSWLWAVASFVIVGLLSVFLMRYAMILFTSLCGSYVVVAGIAGLLHNLKGISVHSRRELIIPMAAWILLFLLGVRTQARRMVRRKHGE